MEIRELRIGNYYQCASRGNIEIVTWQTLRDLAEGKLNLLPMPLTDEILLKFGFYFEEGFYCLRINNTAFMTIILHGSYVNYELSNFRQKIVFSRGEFSGVHQLQNLYFALTGEELTFKKD